MDAKNSIKLKDCLWIVHGASTGHRHCAGYAQGLREMGVRTETFRDYDDSEGVKRINDLLHKTNEHVVLFFLGPASLRVFRKTLEARGNFSLVADDWWIIPHWAIQCADYVLFRAFNAFAARLGWGKFASFRELPLLQMPPSFNRFGIMMSSLRLANLVMLPVLQGMKAWQRRRERLPLERLVYFPYGVRDEDVRYNLDLPFEYEFSNVSNTYGPWIMRDPFAPAWASGANLYADRQRLVEAIAAWEGHPYRFINWQGRNRISTSLYEDLCQVVRQSRFTLCTGGIHQNFLPKFMENACLGTPMFGRPLPYEHPWLKECMYEVDPFALDQTNIRPKLDDALAQHQRLREGCLRMRPRLLEMYSFENCVRLAQNQIDSGIIPEGYLKVDFRSPKQKKQAS